MARNYFILLISFLGAVALADYAIVTGLVDFQSSEEKPQSPDSSVLFRLAEKYETGIEVELDMDKAIYWYKVAAENGSEKAKQRLIALNAAADKTKPNIKNKGNTDSVSDGIDEEAKKITKILEKHLEREEENAKRAKQNKKQENTMGLQQRLTEEKKEAKRIRQIEEAKLNDSRKPTTTSDSELGDEITTFEPQTDVDLDDNTEDNNTVFSKPIPESTDSENFSTDTSIPAKDAIPLALQPQPARPLNLPSTQDTSTPTLGDSESDDYITAYDEEPDNSVEDEEFIAPTKNPTSSSGAINEKPQGEKKEFNVNPCNGPAAKFMSTCR